MAFLRLAFFPGATATHWAALVAAVGDVEAPPARRAFAAGPLQGGWQVVQLWDTRDDLDAFNEAVYLPALERGLVFPNPPVVTDVETEVAWVDGRLV